MKKLKSWVLDESWVKTDDLWKLVEIGRNLSVDYVIVILENFKEFRRFLI